MIRSVLFFIVLSGVSIAFWGPPVLAAGEKTGSIILPAPQTSGGKPLMEALSTRLSNRRFSNTEISQQDISNLLWAAWGINRKDGRRTVPTARNTQAINVYVALKTGVFQYDAAKNTLTRVLKADVSEKLGGAPLTLLYAAPEKDPYAGMHVGSLYQNAGLYCASTGLSNVVKATGARALDSMLTLPDGYKILIIQSVGWPQK